LGTRIPPLEIGEFSRRDRKVRRCEIAGEVSEIGGRQRHILHDPDPARAFAFPPFYRVDGGKDVGVVVRGGR
jgi:hypothetical protein